MSEDIEKVEVKEKKKFFIAVFFEWIGFDEETVAGFFNFIHSAVDLADMPIRRTVMVLQPVIAPLVPAAFIRESLITHMDVEKFVANAAAIALVMIGFSGGIAYTKASVKLERNAESEPLKEDKKRAGIAWGIYLSSIVIITIALEFAYSVSSWWITIVRVLVILALTFGLEVSSSILNATRIVEEEIREQATETDEMKYAREIEQKRIENQYKLDRLKINKGVPLQTYAADVTGASGAPDTPDAKLSAKDKSQIARFRNDLSVTGNWRVDGKKMLKTDLEWLARAETYAIKLAIGGENTPDKTAQNWRKYARQKIGAK